MRHGDMSSEGASAMRERAFAPSRVLIYLVVSLIAAACLVPLVVVVTLGIFLPQQMRLLPWTIVLRDTGLINTLTGLVLIHTIQGLSFTVLFCRNYYIAIPQELIRAARIDGAGFFRIFWRIVLPLSPPILIVTVIWQFTHIWNEFLYGVTFTTGQQQPVTAALIALSASVADIPQHGVQSAAVIIAALPTLLVYLFGGRQLVRPDRRRRK